MPGATSSSDCNACSAKIAINMVTLDREFGSASSSDCVCNARFLDIGKYDDQGNLRAIDARCIDCPDGANCTNAGAALNQVDSLEGFWRADWTSYQFFPCLKEYNDCIGGGIIRNTTFQNVTNGTNMTVLSLKEVEALKVEEARKKKQSLDDAFALARMKEAKNQLRANKGAARIRFRSTSGNHNDYWCIDKLMLFTQEPSDDSQTGIYGISMTESNFIVSGSSTRTSGTSRPRFAIHGNKDDKGGNGIYCTRKYSKEEGALPKGIAKASSTGHLSVEFVDTDGALGSGAQIITHYKVCTESKSYKSVPSSWVLEVSGMHPSISILEARGNYSASEYIATHDLPWIPVSTVRQTETEALSKSTVEQQCKIFSTTMSDIMTSTRRSLWDSSLVSPLVSPLGVRNLVEKDSSTTITSNATDNKTDITGSTMKVNWEKDLQCRFGNMGPLCANCFSGWARSLEAGSPCIDCNVGTEENNTVTAVGRRLSRNLVDASFPIYVAFVESSVVTSYVAHRRRMYAAANGSKCVDATNNSIALNVTNATDQCGYKVGSVLSGERSVWAKLGPTVYLALSLFFFGFFVALIAMALPSELEESEDGQMDSMDQLRNQASK